MLNNEAIAAILAANSREPVYSTSTPCNCSVCRHEREDAQELESQAALLLTLRGQLAAARDIIAHIEKVFTDAMDEDGFFEGHRIIEALEDYRPTWNDFLRS